MRVQTVGSQRTAAGAAFDHPFTLAPQDWATILGSITVQHKDPLLVLLTKKGEASPAFAPDEVAYLSETLAKVFAQAAPSEHVVFGLAREGTGGVTEMTTGGWYVAGGRLHVVLANYRLGVTLPGVIERLRTEPLAHYPAFYEIAPAAHQKLETGAALGRVILDRDSPHLIIDYRALLLAKADERRAPGVGQPAVQSMPSPPPSAEERLEELKRLHERGLITDDEYRDKKKQILDRF